MAKAQKVSQKKWIKGVNAAAMPYAQPQGSFPRVSNLQYIRRGSLYTCDGSKLISAFNGAVQPISTNLGPITELFLYQPLSGPAAYYEIAKDYNTHLGAPVGNAVVADAAAGVLNGTYRWVVTALDGTGGETTVSNEVTAAIASKKADVSWTAVTNAVGYNIYRTVVAGAPGTEKFSGTSATNSYVDNVADGALTSQTPPFVDNTQVSQFYKVVTNSYGVANIVFTFPADRIPDPGFGDGGGFGGSGPGTTSGNQSPTPSGGVLGNISPIPQIVGFRDLMILLLGNGTAPYSSDGTTPNTIQLVNNFQASYAARVASTVQNAGDQISVTIGGKNYVFTATQSGTTAAGGPPAFSATLGSIVSDGTVYWKNTGAIAANTAPRGAAHGIIYAGSLWVFNTSPTTTSDNFDGPSCLKMSDLNNPNSWNPLNVAFLDRDDGTQGMGLATFTIAESGIPPTGSLVAFKDFSTFQINGVFGASNFSIQRAQTDMGCSAPRTIQFVPGFGIVRLTHLGIAVFDGVRDRLLSEEIRPYIFGGQPDISPVDWNFAYFAKAAQTTSPPMYCCAVPLVPTNTLLNGASVAVGNFFGSTLPLGTYFVRVQEILGNGTTFLSPELGPLVIGGSNEIVVTLPQPTPGISKWRIFYGIGSGNETQYQDVIPSSSNTVHIRTPGTAGTFTSLNGALTRILCYDLVLKAWTIVDVPFQISVLKQFRSIGTIPVTTMAGFSDGAVRRWLGGAGLDPQWDAGATNAGAPSLDVQWLVTTPQLFGRDASDRVYFRDLSIRGTGTASNMKAIINTVGMSAPSISVTAALAGLIGLPDYVSYFDIAQTAIDANATIQGSGVIEIQSIDWRVVPKAIGARIAV
jgi:hypothetical protein